MKKFRLKIPEMIRKGDAWKAHALTEIGVHILTEAFAGGMFPISFKMIPKDWLEEIKDEPVRSGAWLENYRREKNIPDTAQFYGGDMIKAFEAGEENNELRHRPKQTFEEWSSTVTGIAPIGNLARFIWNESRINLGFEPED